MRAHRTTKEEARTSARRNAETTGRVWVVVYRPRTKSYDPYSKDTLRRAPITEPHEVVWSSG